MQDRLTVYLLSCPIHPGWIGWQAETAASRAGTGLDKMWVPDKMWRSRKGPPRVWLVGENEGGGGQGGTRVGAGGRGVEGEVLWPKITECGTTIL